MTKTTNEIINDMLWNKTRFNSEYYDTEWAILIHPSTIDKFKNTWQKLSENGDWKSVDYTLRIGSKCYKMFLVVVKVNIDDSYNENSGLLYSTIKNSQFSFPWEEEPTLFINVELFHVMEEFIRIHNLKADILKIEEKTAITWNDEIIKVITFNKSVNKKLNIVKEYEYYIFAFTKNNHQSKYYYITHAFEWLQPCQRELFKIPISDVCYSVFPIILNHLRTLNYINELNIFDLLSIKLAVCDDRNASQSHLLKFDIDFMIKRELAKIVGNNHLDLDQYFIDKNCEKNDFLIGYLVYKFQHLFETVKMESLDILFLKTSSYNMRSDIKLADKCEALNIIKQKSNIKFYIDGSSYDRMSLSLFLNLVECHNVNKITLDTNYKWINDECNLDRDIANLNRVYVELAGTNIYNFIEDFISCLKTVTFPKTVFGGIYLQIKGNINDYMIFDNLNVSDIKWFNVKIDNHILQDLLKCNLKSKIIVWICNFETKRQNWALLNNLGELINVEIREEEGTWQSLFEFIVDEMLQTNAKEFQFDHIRFKIRSEYRSINLGDLKFTFDEVNSKLEIRNRNTNEIIDLFEEKCWLLPPKKSDYDFYQ